MSDSRALAARVRALGENAWVVPAIALAAFSLRVAAALLMPVPARLDADADQYSRIAVNLLTGGGFAILPGDPTAWRAPGYPVFLAAIYWIAGLNQWFVVRLVQAAVDAVTVVLVERLGRAMFGRGVGLVAASLVALSPPLISSTTFVMSETLYTPLLVAALLVYARALREGSVGRGWAAGALFGVGALIRPVALLMPVFVVMATVAWKGVDGMRSRLKIGAAALAATVLTISPWTIRNALVFKAFIPVAVLFGVGLWVGTYIPWDGHLRGWDNVSPTRQLVGGLDWNRSRDQVLVDQRMRAAAFRNIAADPVGQVRFYVRKLPRMWTPTPGTADQVFGSVFLMLLAWLWHFGTLTMALLGTVSARRTPHRSWALWLAILVVLWALVHTVFEPSPRYLLPVLPAIYLLAGLGFASMRHRTQAAGAQA